MADYRCRVGTREGAIVERSVGAVSSAAARKQLQEEGFQVFQIRRAGGLLETATAAVGGGGGGVPLATTGNVTGEASSSPSKSRAAWLFRRQIARSDLLLFSQEMAALVRAGLPLLRCLDILRSRRSGTRAGELLDRVRERVATGAHLSTAFEAEGEQYGIPPLYTTTLEIGEASGDLDGALRRYATHLERAQQLRSRVKGALIYPSVLFSASMVVLSILVGFVLPRFSAFYASYEAELPLITRLLVSTTNVLRAWWLVAFIVVVIAGLSVFAWVRTESGRLRSAIWKQRLPMFGGMRRRYLDIEATRTLATLLRGGAPLIPALNVVIRSTSDVAYRAKLSRVRELTVQGSSLHNAFEEEGLLDPMGLEMVEVGESTGALEEMLEHVSTTYDEVLDRQLATAVSLLEPAVLVTMGVLLAGILMSLYLPLFNTVQVVG
jgi:type IV pilus assembly protein PilC